jgi:hypothetical protein
MRTTHVLRTLVIGALAVPMLATGCAKDPEDTGHTNPSQSSQTTSESASETGSGPGTSGDNSNSETNPTTTGTPPTTGDDTTGMAETSGFIITPDGGGNSNECDIWKQDCPEGQKCMPWANDGGGSWNATKCTPLDANPKQPGDECIADGGGVSGVDNCDIGTMCWFLNEENVGTCIEMCTGSQDNQMCPDGKVCDESNDGVIIVCLETCDPLAQSCPADQICFFDGVSEFICDFDASGDMGAYGDPCAFINVCDYGLFCATQMAVPGCPSADGCCSPFCDVTLENTCPGADMMQECIPWYESQGLPVPPGMENIGACAVPAG